MPYLSPRDGTLRIPLNSPERYRWWQGGQEAWVTAQELGATEEVINLYRWPSLKSEVEP